MNPNWCWCVFKSVLLSVSILIFVSEIHMCFYCFLSHLSGFGIAIRKRIGKLQKKKTKKTPTKSNVLVFLLFSCQLGPTLSDPMDWSMPVFLVHHQLPEFAQIQVRSAGDAILSSHPLSSPSPPAFNLSQHQGLCVLEGQNY